MVILHRKLYFSKDSEWVQHFPGGSNFFPGGGPNDISIETHITGFSGVPDPLIPLWIRTCIRPPHINASFNGCVRYADQKNKLVFFTSCTLK